jgi:hypothetical protein
MPGDDSARHTLAALFLILDRKITLRGRLGHGVSLRADPGIEMEMKAVAEAVRRELDRGGFLNSERAAALDAVDEDITEAKEAEEKLNCAGVWGALNRAYDRINFAGLDFMNKDWPPRDLGVP